MRGFTSRKPARSSSTDMRESGVIACRGERIARIGQRSPAVPVPPLRLLSEVAGRLASRHSPTDRTGRYHSVVVPASRSHPPLISSGRLRKSLRSLLLAAGLALVVLVVRDYLGSKSSGSQAPPAALPVLPADVAAQSRSWRWTQTTGDSTHIEVSADDFTQNSDGVGTDLRGVTLKIFHDDIGTFDRVDSAAMRMLVGGDLYSEGETVISLGVPVQGAGGRPVVVTTSGVTFHPSENSARTDRIVRYTFQGGVGRSIGAVYDAGSATLHMLSDVSVERLGDGTDRPPATIRADGLRYQEAEAKIELTGGAKIEQGQRWLECDKAVIRLQQGRMRRVKCTDAQGGETDARTESLVSAPELEADFGPEGDLVEVRGHGGAHLESVGPEQGLHIRGETVLMRYESGARPGRSWLRHVEVCGTARAEMSLPAGGLRYAMESDRLLLRLGPESSGVEQVETLDRGTLRQSAAGGSGPLRTLQAGRIVLRYTGSSRIESLFASHGTELVQSSGDPGSTEFRTWSEQLEAAFDPETADIAALRQAGSFQFAEEGRSGGATEARFDPDGGILELDGSARIAGAGSTVEATRIVLDRMTGRVEAEGDVSGSLAPEERGNGEAVPAGLFAGPEPVYLAAGALISDPEKRSIEYWQGARMWRGSNRIDAEAITVHHADRRLAARGSVSATWVEGDESSQGPLVTVRSGEMTYREDDGVARFSGLVDFQRLGTQVLSDELRTSLGVGGAQLVVSTGSVRITQQGEGTGLKGFGSRAEFHLADSVVVLTGDPARIIAADGTESEGGSLTYRAAGDSLQVLGRDAERAYSYRPASR